MKLNDMLQVFDLLQRVHIVHGEKAVTGEVYAMQKLLSEETLSLPVTCAAASDSILKVWCGFDDENAGGD